LSNGLNQMREIHWLGQKGIAHPVEFFLAIASHKHDWNVARGGLRLEKQSDLVTAEAGHSHVTNDGAWNGSVYQHDAVAARRCNAGIKATGGENRRNDLGHVFLIIDNYNCRHIRLVRLFHPRP
jgi:hypothetical protein